MGRQRPETEEGRSGSVRTLRMIPCTDDAAESAAVAAQTSLRSDDVFVSRIVGMGWVGDEGVSRREMATQSCTVSSIEFAGFQRC